MSEQATSNPLGGQHKGEGGAMSRKLLATLLVGNTRGKEAR